MINYLNTTYLKNRKNNNIPIIQALLKYGQVNFAVLIVEYVYIEILSVEKLTILHIYYLIIMY